MPVLHAHTGMVGGINRDQLRAFDFTYGRPERVHSVVESEVAFDLPDIGGLHQYGFIGLSDYCYPVDDIRGNRKYAVERELAGLRGDRQYLAD